MKRILALSIVLFLTVALFAVPSVRTKIGFTDEQLTGLLNGGYIEITSYEGDVLSLVPRDCLVYPKVEESLQMEKGFTIVCAGIVPYPEGWDKLTEEEQLLLMVNKCLSTSTMKGMTYISVRAGGKEKVLFDDSSMLGSPNKKDRVGDYHLDTLPEKFEYYLLQDDTSFGSNIYAATISTRKGELLMELENYDALGFMGVKVVAPGKMKMKLQMTLTEEGIYVDVMAAIRDKKPKIQVLFYTVDLEESLMNRIIALKNWFASHLGE